MRELRHDFRAFYGTSYDWVGPGEAVDLVLTLPRGSLYMGAVDPHLAWADARHDAADIKDMLAALTQMLSSAGTTEGAPRVVRPGTREDTARARARASAARDYIEGTEWREVEGG